MKNQQNSIYQQVLGKLKQREGLLRILMFTLVTVFCWIGFSIFLSQKKTKVDQDVQKYTISLNPNIDRVTISEISARRSFLDSELENFPLYKFVMDAGGGRSQIEIGSDTIILNATESSDFNQEEVATSSATQ